MLDVVDWLLGEFVRLCGYGFNCLWVLMLWALRVGLFS